jgi:polysaccharide pyruvyl transferase WcaK-like protein
MVAFLAERHPDARLGFFCMGPEQVSTRYAAPATSLQWYEAHAGTATGVRAVLLKVVGRLLDPFRTLAWIRHYDVVIVPGMGILEATVPVRPWATPYSLLSLCLSARLVGAKVALVSVGANVMRQPLTRWLFTAASRLAHYRSYRDAASWEAARRLGIDVSADEVYPDLVFALPVPAGTEVATGTVGVGLMAYRGSSDERGRAAELHSAYVEAMKGFVRWLVDGGRRVRLFTGDQEDESVLAEVLADVRTHRPGLDPAQVVVEPASTLEELMAQMATVDTVVATRYHNVICALKLCKPTLSVGYAAKHDALMAEMGLGDFRLAARSVDTGALVERFTTLEQRGPQLRRTLAERNLAAMQRLDRQFDALSAALFESGRATAEAAGHVREGAR